MDRKQKSTAEKVAFEHADPSARQEALRQTLDLYQSIPVYNLHGGIIAYANAGGLLVDPATKEKVQRVHAYSAYWASFVTAQTQATTEPPVD